MNGDEKNTERERERERERDRERERERSTVYLISDAVPANCLRRTIYGYRGKDALPLPTVQFSALHGGAVVDLTPRLEQEVTPEIIPEVAPAGGTMVAPQSIQRR